jgi:taurine dioxygenase
MAVGAVSGSRASELSEQPEEYRTISVRELAPALGAEVSGIDLRSALSDQQVHEIRTALVRHLVLFFPGQPLTDQQQVDLSSHFGEVQEALRGGFFSFMEDTATDPPQSDMWHTDVSNRPEPPIYGFINALDMPSSGGDTCWVSLYALFEALSAPMQSFVGSLKVRHGANRYLAGVLERVKGHEAAERARKEAFFDHPLVKIHPISKRKALYLCPRMTEFIVGLDADESESLLQLFNRMLDNPNFQIRWHWTAGDVAIWDQRCTNHRALSDHFPQYRRIRRTGVIRED